MVHDLLQSCRSDGVVSGVRLVHDGATRQTLQLGVVPEACVDPCCVGKLVLFPVPACAGVVCSSVVNQVVLGVPGVPRLGGVDVSCRGVTGAVGVVVPTRIVVVSEEGVASGSTVVEEII